MAANLNVGFSGDINGDKAFNAPEKEVELVDLDATTDRAKEAEKKGDPEETRARWNHRWDFTLSALGYVVGFGNVWRFPYLAYRNGGGSFLVPYTVMLFLIGLPLFFLEVTIGQYSNNGPTRVFKRLAPAMKGIGFAMLFISCIMAVYYNVLIAWAIHYLISGMASNLPWMHNGTSTEFVACSNSKANDESHDESDHTCVFSTIEYFNETIGLGDGSINSSKFQGMKWELVGCLFATWVTVCACCILGVRSIGKVVYFTVPFPYAALVIMFVWSLTLEGSGEGIQYYLTPNATLLKDPNTWSVAATQIFYSLSVGWGGLTSLASHNDFNTNCHRSSVIICIANCLTSVFAGFVTFAVLGNMAHGTGLEFKHMLHHMLDGRREGSELPFIAFPMLSSVPQLWSFLFFLMLITLGLDNAFVTIDTITTAIEENFSCVSRNNRRMLVVVGTCTISFLLGLSMVTKGGKDMLELLDGATFSWNVLLIALLEVLVVAWMYGADTFWADIEKMGIRKRSCVKWYWIVCWKAITPLILAVLVVVSFVHDVGVTAEETVHNGVIRWLITLTSVGIIPGFAIHEVIKRYHNREEVGVALFRRTNSY